MLKTNYLIDVSLYSNTPSLLDAAVQGDHQTRTLKIRFLDRNGALLAIPEGASLSLNVKKPDGTLLVLDGQAEGLRAVFVLTKQALAAVGKVTATALIKVGEQELRSQPLLFMVTEDAVSAEAVMSTNEFKGLAEALAKAEQMQTAYQEAASNLGNLSQVASQTDTDRKAAEAARVASETAKAAAEKCKTDACACASTADTKAQEATQKASSATTAAQTATSKAAEAKTSASQAASSKQAVEGIRDGIVTEERKRVQAETARGQAEQTRSDAEGLRGQAETARSQAEQTRQTREAARLAAETAREQAETSRHARANQDHQQAVQDHAEHQSMVTTISSLESGQLVSDVADIKQKKADKTYVDGKFTEIIGTAPEALDTLGELAAALNGQADFATQVTSQIATKANATDVTAQIATAQTGLQAQIDSKASKSEVASGLAGKVDSAVYADKVNAIDNSLASKLAISAYAPDKAKLDGMEAGANKTVLANNLTTSTTGQALDAVQGRAIDTRLKAAEDKLQGIETGANKTVMAQTFGGSTEQAASQALLTDSLQYIRANMGVYTVWVGTKAEYDALGSKSDSTLYFVKEA